MAKEEFFNDTESNLMGLLITGGAALGGIAIGWLARNFWNRENKKIIEAVESRLGKKVKEATKEELENAFFGGPEKKDSKANDKVVVIKKEQPVAAPNK